MPATLEELVETLENTTSAWGLSDDLPELKEGLADLLQRLRALEAARKTLTKPAGQA